MTKASRSSRTSTQAATPPFVTASRRNLGGMLGALLLLGTMEAGSAKAEELDGELLSAYREWLPLEKERLAVEALADNDPSYDERYHAYTGPWHDLMQDMMEMPARTPEGIQAKAHVLHGLLRNHIGMTDANFTDADSSSEGFAWSLVRDMLGRAGA